MRLIASGGVVFYVFLLLCGVRLVAVCGGVWCGVAFVSGGGGLCWDCCWVLR